MSFLPLDDIDQVMDKFTQVSKYTKDKLIKQIYVYIYIFFFEELFSWHQTVCLSQGSSMAKCHCYLYRYPLSSDQESWQRRVGTVLEQMPRACASSANAAGVIPESIVHRFAIN